MKLKYYLRGLGIGVLVSVFIMGVAAGDVNTLTDEEIKARAAELGMVEQGTLVLSDLKKEDVEEPSATNAGKEPEASDEQSVVNGSEPKEAEEETGDGTKESEEETGGETGKPEEEENGGEPGESEKETGEPAQETQENEEPGATDEPALAESSTASGAIITIVVERGDSSVSVSKALAEAGLVENAGEYDRYLCSNGYDKKLRIGTYEIAMGSSYEEIAQIITGK